MTNVRLYISIALMIIVTFGTRLFPFVIFGRGKKPASVIIYLGNYLPPALITSIIIYCFRDVTLFNGNYALPEIISAFMVILLHYRFKNTMLSIVAGTLAYMLLIRFLV